MLIAKRLAGCLRQGNLTVADLARWFERPDPTVRGWVGGKAVGGPSRDKRSVKERLALLEKQVRIGKLLPVPSMSQRKRAAYIEQIKLNTLPP